MPPIRPGSPLLMGWDESEMAERPHTALVQSGAPAGSRSAAHYAQLHQVQQSERQRGAAEAGRLQEQIEHLRSALEGAKAAVGNDGEGGAREREAEAVARAEAEARASVAARAEAAAREKRAEERRRAEIEALLLQVENIREELRKERRRGSHLARQHSQMQAEAAEQRGRLDLLTRQLRESTTQLALAHAREQKLADRAKRARGAGERVGALVPKLRQELDALRGWLRDTAASQAASLELAIDAVRQAGAEATNRHSAELRKDIHARLLSQGITERHAALLLGPYCPEGAAMPPASRAAPAATR